MLIDHHLARRFSIRTVGKTRVFHETNDNSVLYTVPSAVGFPVFCNLARFFQNRGSRYRTKSSVPDIFWEEFSSVRLEGADLLQKLRGKTARRLRTWILRAGARASCI